MADCPCPNCNGSNLNLQEIFSGIKDQDITEQISAYDQLEIIIDRWGHKLDDKKLSKELRDSLERVQEKLNEADDMIIKAQDENTIVNSKAWVQLGEISKKLY